MADPIVSNSYPTSAIGNLVGNGNSNQSAAANSIWQYGQYQPYTVNNPMGSTSFSNGTANSSLSPLQSQLQSLFGNTINSNLGGSSSTYNPNTSFLPQQYQSIFGNMQGNVNSQYNSLQQAQAPFTAQYLQSNLDNEQSKGTLASTAGAYQTAGAQTAANAQSNANYAQAQNYALNTANSQFGAASNTASLGEQQSEFGPQYAQSQTQGLFSNLLNQNQLSAQITGLGGSLGAQQSSANTSALMPAYGASQTQDATQSGLLNSLLFGNGSSGGGLLGSLLGSSGGSGGALGTAGSGIASLLKGLLGGSSGALPTISGSGAAISGSAADTGSLGGNPIGSPDVNTGDPGTGLDFSGGMSDQDLDSLIESFSSAGGQAADLGLGSGIDTGSPGDGLDFSVGNINLDNSPSIGLGAVGQGLGIAGDLASGTASGYARAGLSGASLASNQGLFGSSSSSIGGAANSGLSALGLIQGIQTGGVSGGLEAAASGAKLASSSGLLSSGASSALGTAAGALAAPLSLYNFAQNYQSGATGSDALNGAETGATIGSIVPGIGNLIGGLVGGAVGAVSSAFGGGKPDPETQMMTALDSQSAATQQQYLSDPNNAFTYLTGMFDAKNNTPGHSTALEQVFGRMGEGNFTTQMTNQISSAVDSGKITASTPPDQIYSQIVEPWLNSVGASVDPKSTDISGNNFSAPLTEAIESMIGKQVNTLYAPRASDPTAQYSDSQIQEAMAAGYAIPS